MDQNGELEVVYLFETELHTQHRHRLLPQPQNMLNLVRPAIENPSQPGKKKPTKPIWYTKNGGIHET